MAKNRKLYIICVVLAVFALIFALGSVYARYVYSNDGESTLYAKDFYFASDILKAGGVTYTLSTDATGKTSVSFNVCNCAAAPAPADGNRHPDRRQQAGQRNQGQRLGGRQDLYRHRHIPADRRQGLCAEIKCQISGDSAGYDGV